MGATGPTAADAAAHELLLRLAGRLPDELAWRLRDWLATGAREVLAGMLPRTLLRCRIGLTVEERDLLGEAVAGWSGPRRLLDAVVPDAEPAGDRGAPRFRPGPEPFDTAALSVVAVVRGHAGCARVDRAVRLDGPREQPVVVVRGGERPWLLAGTVARVLRAHGDRTPCVEVLFDTRTRPATAYHRAALAAATPLWQRNHARGGTPVGV